MDFAVDAIVSKEVNERVESRHGGFIVRGQPSGAEISNGFRYGFGVGLPSRKSPWPTAELHGEAYVDDTLSLTRSLIGEDGSIAPSSTNPIHRSTPRSGSRGRARRGSCRCGLNYRIKMDGRSEFGSFEDETGDSLGFQMRLGYHPVRIYVRRRLRRHPRRRHRRRR